MTLRDKLTKKTGDDATVTTDQGVVDADQAKLTADEATLAADTATDATDTAEFAAALKAQTPTGSAVDTQNPNADGTLNLYQTTDGQTVSVTRIPTLDAALPEPEPGPAPDPASDPTAPSPAQS